MLPKLRTQSVSDGLLSNPSCYPVMRVCHFSTSLRSGRNDTLLRRFELAKQEVAT